MDSHYADHAHINRAQSIFKYVNISHVTWQQKLVRLSGATQNGTGSHSRLVSLKDSSSCPPRAFSFNAVTSDLFIRDLAKLDKAVTKSTKLHFDHVYS